jgi:hypothetical protein
MKQLIILATLTIISVRLIAESYLEHNHHKLTVHINIEESTIDVTDSITISKEDMEVFFLNTNLSIYSSNLEIEKLGTEKGYTIFKVKRDLNGNQLNIKYRGRIDHNKEALRNITRANMYQSTDGVIFEKGIYLSGSTYWVPDFKGSNLKTFSINVNVDKEWELVSQGNLTATLYGDSIKTLTFTMNHPTNQVYLVGNQWTKYTKKVNSIDVSVYLINPDDVLAQKYLEATTQNLDLYNNIIGEFPYSKFDVLENFWESGYGMPSFTLLGQRVMRFPWILNTSYPHELLHNYWGNGVYVDYDKGNWSEGITTYMADHLLKQKDGEDNAYRRSILKKYADYVNPENEFPASEFKSKYNEASEAIGYNKVLMINHMLRIKYGTEAFQRSYADFYQNHKFTVASFDDIQKSFEKTTGENLDVFFNQWLRSTGAPTLELGDIQQKRKKEKYTISFELTQKGTERPFSLDIPIYVYLKGSNVVERRILSLTQWAQKYSLTFLEVPIRIDVDPRFDVMRIVDPMEAPPTLSQILGSKKWTIILPKQSKAYFYYKNLAINWIKMYEKQGVQIEIVNDTNIESMPYNQSVWVFGSENRFSKSLDLEAIYSQSLSKEIIEQIDDLNSNETIVYTLSNPKNNKETIGYINSNYPETVGQLAMKFIHYGNFSFIGFKGKYLQRNLTGNFPILDSPLNYLIDTKQTENWNDFAFPDQEVFSGNK